MSIELANLKYMTVFMLGMLIKMCAFLLTPITLTTSMIYLN